MGETGREGYIHKYIAGVNEDKIACRSQFYKCLLNISVSVTYSIAEEAALVEEEHNDPQPSQAAPHGPHLQGSYHKEHT